METWYALIVTEGGQILEVVGGSAMKLDVIHQSQQAARDRGVQRAILFVGEEIH